jgi:hypothetical protein
MGTLVEFNPKLKLYQILTDGRIIINSKSVTFLEFVTPVLRSPHPISMNSSLKNNQNLLRLNLLPEIIWKKSKLKKRR